MKPIAGAWASSSTPCWACARRSNAAACCWPTSASTSACGNCDVCLDPPQAWDGTVAAQKVLSAVYRLWKERGQRYGAGHIIDILRGKSTERTKQHGHETLSVFGVGADLSDTAWRGVLRHAGAGPADRGQRGVRHAGADRRQPRRAQGRAPAHAASRIRKKGRASKTGSGASRPPPWTCRRNCNRCSRRCAWRGEVAKSHGVPAYVIFHDATLREIALAQPETLDALSHISGVGARKLEAYGEEILQRVARPIV